MAEGGTIERKFAVKDFILLASVVLLGILLLLSMYMIDRQWRMMSLLQQNVQEQAADLRAMRDSIRSLSNRPVLSQTQLSQTQVSPDNSLATDTGIFGAAAALREQADFADGDWLVNVFPVGLKTISPLVSVDAYAAEVQNYVLESLLRRDPESLEWRGLLARSWQVQDDGLAIDFTLHDGLVFSDGEPLTVADVVFSYQFIMDERIAAPRHRATMDKVSDVVALDEHRVRFVFTEPYFESLGLAGEMHILPRHFYKPLLEEPESFNQSRGILLGSGPYRLEDPESWTPDQGRVELVRNQRYWSRTQPPYERVIWNVIENDSARLAAFRNRSIDTYNARPREYKTLLTDQQIVDSKTSFEFMSPTAGYSYIGWNAERDGVPTVFSDVRIRRAMTLLTDRKRIVEEIMLGYAEIAVSPFNPRSKQHNPSVVPRLVDIGKARELFEQAGFADRDGDGQLESAEGVPLEFKLMYFQDSEDTARIVLFLKDLYARAGVLLIPQPSEWSVMIDALNSRNFDAITLGWSSGVETDIFQMFHGSQIDDGGDNFIHFSNPELDRLIEQARSTVDENARMALWWQAEEILHQQQPYTFLMRRKSLQFVDNRFKNIEVNNLGLNFEQVPVVTYVPAAQQLYNQ